MSLFSFCHSVTVNNLFFSTLVLVYNLIFFVNKSNLNSFITVILYCLHLCYHTRTSLMNDLDFAFAPPKVYKMPEK